MPKPKKRWRKILICVVITIATFFCIFNTSTRYGRWLFYRGAFNDARYLPSVPVDNSESVVKERSQSSNAVLLRVLETFKIGNETLEDFFFSRDSNAVVITHRGDIVFERYENGFDKGSVHPTYSITKSIISLMVGKAIADNQIESIDDPISKYVQGLDEAFDVVTIRHCLNMASGLSLNVDTLFGVPAPWNDEVKDYYDPNVRALVSQMDLANRPNSKFTYQNFNQILLGMALEKATGESLAAYASEQLWKPLGMEYPASWSVDSLRHKFPKPGSGFNATAVDLARLGNAVFTRGDVIPQSWALALLEPACVQPEFKLPPELENDEPKLVNHIRSVRYANGWWGLDSAERYDLYANGNFGQFLYVSKEAELVVVRLGSHWGKDANDLTLGMAIHEFASESLDAIRKHKLEAR